MKKIAALTTALVISITMLSTISASAKSVKVPRVKITKLKSTKPGNLTMKIKKIKKVSGYKVKLSQNKKFKKSKTYKIKKNQKTVKGLKQGKKYFVKVRAYKKIKFKRKSKTVYGKWSKVKSMKIKIKENNKNEEPNDNNPSVTYNFDEEKDKERRAEIKDKIGIDFSKDVHFLNYTCNQYIYEQYDNAVSYTIYAKIKIKANELIRIINDNSFDKSYIHGDIETRYNCDWWTLNKSIIKRFYSHPHSLWLTEDTCIKTVWQYLIITEEKDSNGYLTVYMQLK